jgi:hypothetical protein
VTAGDVIIIGAGASGLFCALCAAGRGRKVLVLDHGDTPARKLGISGGGRCNFTNLSASAADYLCGNPHFVKSALAGFSPWDMLSFLAERGIGCDEKAEGQYFCDQGAEHLVDVLVEECKSLGVGFFMQRSIEAVERRAEKGDYIVQCEDGETFTAESLVVATGGISWPGVGASGFGYDIAKHFGLPVTKLRPALVPLVMGKKWQWADLSGLSFRGALSPQKGKGEAVIDDVLITHRGLSGPALLKWTLRNTGHEPFFLDLLPGQDVDALLRDYPIGKKQLRNVLSELLPARLAERLCPPGTASMPVAELAKQKRQAVAEGVNRRAMQPSGPEGWNKAEVTAGGVDTRMISSKTMEATQVPGLFFIGEVLDVAGSLGGYNLQWAWASGHAAGKVV